MKERALCIRCGTFKQNHSAPCRACAFLPTEDIDLAKSRILDFPYTFTIASDGTTVETGRTRTELLEISRQLKAGTYAFPEAEVQGVLEAWRHAKHITTRVLMVSLVKWLAPPLALAAVFLVALLWQRAA